MKFLVITHVSHIRKNKQYFAYAPYVREMNIWLKHVDAVTIVAPINDGEPTPIDIKYVHDNLNLDAIPKIEFTGLLIAIKSLFKIPLIGWKIFINCRNADHIHLRCPGNIGLLGCLIQIVFPKKVKTAKYAGNWDPKSKQPLSYRLQKFILKNTFLTKNINVLVYGDYKDQSKNIKPFFTATYLKNEIEHISERDYTKPLKFLFIGSLVDGKRPLLALKIIEGLIKEDVDVSLDFYGDGEMLQELKAYTSKNDLVHLVGFKGVQSKDTIKSVLRTAHFLLLPSKSEGWPKVIAEAMFFGTIPIATKISCIPYMLDWGKRGLLIQPDVSLAVKTILEYIESNKLNQMVLEGAEWSRKYTLEKFEDEISILVN